MGFRLRRQPSGDWTQACISQPESSTRCGHCAPWPPVRASHSPLRSWLTPKAFPFGFLRAILNDLRRVGIVTSQRGNEGGYKLARPAAEITIGEVFRRLEGPLAEVRGMRPESASYEADAVHLQKVWVAVRACLRGVLDEVTLEQVVSGKLPNQVIRLVSSPGAWEPH